MDAVYTAGTVEGGTGMNDVEFQSHILTEICNYAVEQGMEPDDTVRTIANNLLAMLNICTFNGWGEGEKECA